MVTQVNAERGRRSTAGGGTGNGVGRGPPDAGIAGWITADLRSVPVYARASRPSHSTIGSEPCQVAGPTGLGDGSNQLDGCRVQSPVWTRCRQFIHDRVCPQGSVSMRSALATGFRPRRLWCRCRSNWSSSIGSARPVSPSLRQPALFRHGGSLSWLTPTS